MLNTSARVVAIIGCLAAGRLPVVQDAVAQDVQVETVVSGLDNPWGIAVQPRTGNVFVSESGALRVIKFNPRKIGPPVEVITGFPADTYGSEPAYTIGPLGLAFISPNTLAVGGGGLAEGEELLRIYELRSRDGAIAAEKMKHRLGPLPGSQRTGRGADNFYGLVATTSAIYVTSGGSGKGWVLKVGLENGKPNKQNKLQPMIATKDATGVDHPVGITIKPGQEGPIVVAQMGEIDQPGDSLLAFFDPTNGKMLMSLPTGLFDITGLAYSQSNRLYAIDFAWQDPSQGGLYRLDATYSEGRQGMRAVRLASLDKPSAMAFASDGSLYVTVFGTAEEGSDEKPGKVVKITGDL